MKIPRPRGAKKGMNGEMIVLSTCAMGVRYGIVKASRANKVVKKTKAAKRNKAVIKRVTRRRGRSGMKLGKTFRESVEAMMGSGMGLMMDVEVRRSWGLRDAFRILVPGAAQQG